MKFFTVYFYVSACRWSLLWLAKNFKLSVRDEFTALIIECFKKLLEVFWVMAAQLFCLHVQSLRFEQNSWHFADNILNVFS